MLVISHTLRSTIYVSVALAIALAVAGGASSTYHREREMLGVRHFKDGEWAAQHGHFEDAIDQYRRALLFSPDDEQYRLSLAITLLNSNHLSEAQGHLDQLADEDPTNGRINIALGEIAEKQGKSKLAIERYQRAVYQYWPPDEVPERRQARWELVRLLDNAGRGSEAVGELIQLYASSPHDATERARIGFDLLQHGATSEAVRVFHEIETGFPGFTDAHRGLGESYFAEGDYVSARHEFQHALRTSPKNAPSQQDLALTNAVIDLDPLLPGLGYGERLRRSHNLLQAVVNDLTTCSPGVPTNANAASELEVAAKLMNQQNNVQDLPDVMQQTASQLWRDRALFCKAESPSKGRALQIAISRVAGE